ncbi:MAG: hypothetical protein HYX71_01855 [Opitutae bacterium]|nr:hypothetical protein [Opitutae bacterium]
MQSLPYRLSAAMLGVVVSGLLLSACGKKPDSPPVTLQLFVDDRGFPHINYSAGPFRQHSYSSNLYKYEARLGPVGGASSVELAGSLTWKDTAKKLALVSFQLRNTEPVVIELSGLHPTNKDATETEAVIRQTFAPGSHEFAQEYWVVFVSEH